MMEQLLLFELLTQLDVPLQPAAVVCELGSDPIALWDGQISGGVDGVGLWVGQMESWEVRWRASFVDQVAN